MDTLGRYDADLEMYVEPEHNLDMTVLEFWKWLCEQGRLWDDDDHIRPYN